jgi:hypothetical protein
MWATVFLATVQVGECSQATAKLRDPAAVAELVDAQASGACVPRDVEVRLLSAALRAACC